jgi:hypothetical protein
MPSQKPSELRQYGSIRAALGLHEALANGASIQELVQAKAPRARFALVHENATHAVRARRVPTRSVAPGRVRGIDRTIPDLTTSQSDAIPVEVVHLDREPR